MAGIQLSKNNYCIVEAGRYENLMFEKRDTRNYIRKVRLLYQITAAWIRRC